MAAAAIYTHDIPSVQDVNPALPPVLGHLDLNRTIFAGDPIICQNLSHAKAVVMTLKGLNGSMPNFAK